MSFEQARVFKYRFVDLNTGEVLTSKRKTCTYCCHGDGERFLRKLFDSFDRGLRAGRDLKLEIDCTAVDVIQIPLFTD